MLTGTCLPSSLVTKVLSTKMSIFLFDQTPTKGQYFRGIVKLRLFPNGNVAVESIIV